MADLLVDTDVFIDHLRGAHRLNPGRNVVSYSVVTRAELFAGAADQEPVVAELLAPFRELGIDRDVAERAGRLRRQVGTRLPDALIAATALEAGLTLISRNTRDFDPIPGLKLREPH